jgi:hypothetical protein
LLSVGSRLFIIYLLPTYANISLLSFAACYLPPPSATFCRIRSAAFCLLPRNAFYRHFLCFAFSFLSSFAVCFLPPPNFYRFFAYCRLMPSTDFHFLLFLLSIFCRVPSTATFAAITVSLNLPDSWLHFFVRSSVSMNQYQGIFGGIGAALFNRCYKFIRPYSAYLFMSYTIIKTKRLTILPPLLPTSAAFRLLPLFAVFCFLLPCAFCYPSATSFCFLPLFFLPPSIAFCFLAPPALMWRFAAFCFLCFSAWGLVPPSVSYVLLLSGTISIIQYYNARVNK